MTDARYPHSAPCHRCREIILMAVIIADITITAQIYMVIICLQKFFSFYTFFNAETMRIISTTYFQSFKFDNSTVFVFIRIQQFEMTYFMRISFYIWILPTFLRCLNWNLNRIEIFDVMYELLSCLTLQQGSEARLAEAKYWKLCQESLHSTSPGHNK